MAASDSFFTLTNVQVTANTLSATITLRADGTSWTLTCVYGPQSEADKTTFIEELKSLQPLVRQQLLLLGDFNLITKASDKSNLKINRRLMGKFRKALDHLQLKELKLNGCRFTWTNEQQQPVLTKIDHLFCIDDWDVLFPGAHL